MGELNCGPVGKLHLRGSPHEIVHDSKQFICLFMVGNGCIKSYSLLRVRLRLNTFCRKKFLEREAYWLSALDLQVPHKHGKLCFGPSVNIGYVSLCEECGMCFRPGVCQGAWSHLNLRCVPIMSLLYITNLPGMVLPSNRYVQQFCQVVELESLPGDYRRCLLLKILCLITLEKMAQFQEQAKQKIQQSCLIKMTNNHF